MRLSDNVIDGFEALLRWPDSSGNICSPGDFIQFAEERDMIVTLSRWVLRKVCKQQKCWLAAGAPPVSVSVNFSPKHLQYDGVDVEIERIIESADANPALLEIEITEGPELPDLDSPKNTMLRLKQLGIKFALDDYGAGSNQLEMLRELPLDHVKIDKKFFENIGTYKNDEILKSALMMINQLNLKSIAEGVEKKSQMEFLTKNNCDQIQGFLVGKPMHPENIQSSICSSKIL